jgi:hypothetical protein
MLLKREGREVNAGSKDLRFRQNTNTSDTVNLHLHVRITIRVTKISQVRTPRGIFGITFDDNGVLVESLGECKGSLGLLPGVEIVGLFTT